MKNALLVICLVLGFNAQAQCVAKAGANQHACLTHANSDTLILGGNYSGINTSGWQFQWFIKPISHGSSWVYHASDFLNDTALANPKLVNFPLADSLTLYLKVISPADTCVDSCLITHTQFIQHLGIFTHYPAVGDTFQLLEPNIGLQDGAIDSLEWLPHTYLINPFVPRPYSVATANISYRVVVHANGCTDTGAVFQHVIVHPMHLAEQPVREVEVYPNPVRDELHIRWPGQDGEIRIFDLAGHLMQQSTFRQGAADLKVSLPGGLYLVKVQTSRGKSHLQRLRVK